MASIFDAKLSNPVGKWVEYKGGKFQFYDKEGKANVVIGDTLTILPLFVHNGIAGFHKTIEKGIYSNEVDSLKDQKLVVKCDGQTIEEGFYNDIKESIKNKGGKFAKIVYALLISNEVTELVAFKFSGAACGCWMDGFKESTLPKMKVLKLTPAGTQKKGSNTYNIFKVLTGERSDKYADLANSYGLTLQQYFNQYFNTPEIKQEEPTVDDINAEIASVLSEEIVPAFDDKDGTEVDDLPF